MWKLTRLSSLQETKSLASHPLWKNPQSLVGQKMKMKEKTRIYMKNRASALFVDSIYQITYFSERLLRVFTREFIQEGNLPFLGYFLAKELHEWMDTRRKWKFIQKYLKKRSPNVGSKYREALRTISQEKMVSARFRRRTRGLRNHFAATSDPRRAAKLASALRFSTSSLRHVSGSFRRNSIALYKKAAKFSQQKADFATLQSD